MTEAASQQALEEGKRRLRDFLETSDTGRQAMAMSGAGGKNSTEEYEMSRLNGKNRDGKGKVGDDEDDEDDL